MPSCHDVCLRVPTPGLCSQVINHMAAQTLVLNQDRCTKNVGGLPGAALHAHACRTAAAAAAAGASKLLLSSASLRLSLLSRLFCRCMQFYIYLDPASSQWSMLPWDVESGESP